MKKEKHKCYFCKRAAYHKINDKWYCLECATTVIAVLHNKVTSKN